MKCNVPRDRSQAHAAYDRVLGVGVSALSALLVSLCATQASANPTVVTIQSGNGSICTPDTQITYISPACGWNCGFPGAFTPAQFAAPGVAPVVITPPLDWVLTLADCNPLAQWVAADCSATNRTMLLRQEFQIPNECFTKATLFFCWAVDDVLGDPAGGPNSAGVYLNGHPLPISGGTWSSMGVEIIQLDRIWLNGGSNTLYVYVRDTNPCCLSGVIYSATFLLTDDGLQECDWCTPITLPAPGTANSIPYFYTDKSTVDGASSCDSGAMTYDMWFCLTAPTGAPCPNTRRVRLDTCWPGNDDTVLSVHEACTPGVPSDIACNDNDPTGACSPGSRLDFFPVPGQTYYIRVAGRGTPPCGEGVLNITHIEEPIPDCIEPPREMTMWLPMNELTGTDVHNAAAPAGAL